MTVEQLSTSKISSTCPTGVNYISKYAGDLREKSHEVWTRNSNRSRCTAKKMTGGGAIKAPPPPMGLGLKGKFPQTTTWIGWVESNFRNPSVKVWADLDNPFKRIDYKCKVVYVALSGWNSARICDITRGQLSIDFVQRFSQFFIFLGYH